jgi:type I restriction-modification system DNA methylase subunit
MLILANPPFAGSLDYESTSKDLQRVVKTKKTELLFIALFLKLLKPGGRVAVIVPDGVLFGSSKAHKEIRRILVEHQKLEGVVKLPSGVFRPYAGVSTAVLLFTKTNSGGTNDVWFYAVQADGLVIAHPSKAMRAGKTAVGRRPPHSPARGCWRRHSVCPPCRQPPAPPLRRSPAPTRLPQ